MYTNVKGALLVFITLINLFFLSACKKNIEKISAGGPNGVPTDHPAPTQDFFVIDTEWDLSWSLDGNELTFRWPKYKNVFLYRKEHCDHPELDHDGMYARCKWEVIHHTSVREEGSEYVYKTKAKKKFFPPYSYKLGRTFSYTVMWDPSDYERQANYQVFFYGKRGYSYHYDLPLDKTIYTFPHLDPSNLPYTFTNYVLVYANDEVDYAGYQYEIDYEVLTEEPEEL